MLIRKGEKSYICSKIRTHTIGDRKIIHFSIIEPATHKDVADLFEDNTFYFYDDLLKGRLPDTKNTKMVGLRIEYNADSTCNITIKLTKGDGFDES